MALFLTALAVALVKTTISNNKGSDNILIFMSNS
jgi:hypothetical protein